jgi:GT2 family glycosyltransferase
MPPTISVVIATYNRPEALELTLADLATQTHLPLEVIVIDQSRDQFGKPIDHEKELKSNLELRYFQQSIPNAQAARNRGIRAARGEVVLLIDDDVRIPPGFIANHVRNYESEPDLDGVSGQTLEPGQLPTGEFPGRYTWPHNGWMFFPLNFNQRRRAINWPSCNGSVRRDKALAIGGFDRQFTRTWFDDADFSWRLHLAGAKIVFDPAASLVHLKIPSGGKRPSGRDRYVLFDAESWSILFYYWRKNFGVCRVWRHVAYYVRGHLCRKVLLRRPHLLLLAFANFFQGYYLAARKLKAGPLYLTGQEEGMDNCAQIEQISMERTTHG